jgi:hypothetical protein
VATGAAADGQGVGNRDALIGRLGAAAATAAAALGMEIGDHGKCNEQHGKNFMAIRWVMPPPIVFSKAVNAS